MLTEEFNNFVNKYNRYLSKPRLLREHTEERDVGFFLGSFKPPHVGHFNAVEKGANENSEFHVVISPGFRGMTKEDHKLYGRIKQRRYSVNRFNKQTKDPEHKNYGRELKPLRGIEDQIKEMESTMIQPMQSKLIWDEYLKALPDNVTIHSIDNTEFADPVKYTEYLIQRYAQQPDGESINIKLYIGEDDIAKGDPRNAPLKNIEGLASITEVPALRSFSATDARLAIVNGNKEEFVASQPPQASINKNYIWDILYDNVSY